MPDRGAPGAGEDLAPSPIAGFRVTEAGVAAPSREPDPGARQVPALVRWYRHAEDAGFVFLGIARGTKAVSIKSWQLPGANEQAGKYCDADGALQYRERTGFNLGVGIERGGRGYILDADDGVAVRTVEGWLQRAGQRTLSAVTPRGRAYFFTLPGDGPPAVIKENMFLGFGGLGTRIPGQYQVGPGSQVDAGAYGPNKPPPDASGGPWKYTVLDVCPVIELPAHALDRIRTARARRDRQAAKGPSGPAGSPPSREAGSERLERLGPEVSPERLYCTSVRKATRQLVRLVRETGRGRNDSLYAVACSLVWHRVLKPRNAEAVAQRLVPVQAKLRAGESRDVEYEVREQIRHALGWVVPGGVRVYPDAAARRKAERADTQEDDDMSEETRTEDEACQEPPGEEDPAKAAAGDGVTDDFFSDLPLGEEYEDSLEGDVKRWAGWLAEVDEWKPRTPDALRKAAPGFLDRVRRRVRGDHEDTLDPVECVQRAVDAFGEGGDAAVLAEIERQEGEGIDVGAECPDQPVPAREWLVPRWLPRGRVGLFYGKGEAGKSRLALQLCAAVASGAQDWVPPHTVPSGQRVVTSPDSVPLAGAGTREPEVAVLVSWEDEVVEQWRKLQGGVLSALRLAAPPTVVLEGRLHVVYLGGRGPAWAPGGGSGHTSTVGALTATGRWIRRYCEKVGARLLVLDPVAAAFMCNENDRGLVRDYMADWDAWGMTHDCAVVNIAHPPKNTEGDPAYGHSGSTDWHSVSRFVWKLDQEETGNGAPIQKNGKDTGQKEKDPAPRLTCVKSSYSTMGKPDPVWLQQVQAGWRAVPPFQAGVGARPPTSSPSSAPAGCTDLDDGF